MFLPASRNVALPAIVTCFGVAFTGISNLERDREIKSWNHYTIHFGYRLAKRSIRSSSMGYLKHLQ